jgi:hypothetical protein
MALGSTQPLREVSTRNPPGVKGRPTHKADNLTAICEPRRLATLWASTACYSDSFTFTQRYKPDGIIWGWRMGPLRDFMMETTDED